MFAYTGPEDMKDIACNIGDIVVLAIAGKNLSCERPDVLVVDRKELALKGTLELRLGQKTESSKGEAATASAVHEVDNEDKIYRLEPAKPRN